MITLRFRALLLAAVALMLGRSVFGQTVVFGEAGFPTADTQPLAVDALRDKLEGARVVNAHDLAAALADDATRLLVMPYGSAYPEQQWEAILKYLDRGGNLIVLGGKPFTRAAYADASGWHLRPASVAASLELFIHDYQETAGSAGLTFEANEDVSPQVEAFAWRRALSPVIRLSVTSREPKDTGSNGNQDAFLTSLAWGVRDGHKLAAPVFLVDHVAERFVGGRWIFVACDADAESLQSAEMLRTLQTLALRRGDRFTLRPRMAVFLPEEPLEFALKPAGAAQFEPGDKLTVRVTSENAAPHEMTFAADAAKTITLPAASAPGKGLHTVEATLMRNGAALWTYRTGFWYRDRAWLLSGPKLSVGADYFELNGKPLPVVGTTYMASDVGRWYLYEPNPQVWDADIKQIRGAGLNMLRTGVWTSWDLLTKPDHAMTEETLRAIEAFLMTARKYELPVQFNLFAFNPDLTGKGHPYLAQGEEQERYVTSVVSRFHDVPFLAWDLINEPTANRNLWRSMPSMEERANWRAWLKGKYPDQAALTAGWAEPQFGIGRRLQSSPTSTRPESAAQNALDLPKMGDLDADAVRSGFNPLKVYDYFLFTQSMFRSWVERQQQTIRAAGSQQLITVGQDEGGVAGRVSPMFFSPDVSFTATHTWWDFDSILWAGLSAKMPGKPMLVQETGEQRRLTQDDHLRLSADEEAWQLERKMAASFAQGAGGIEWVWNVNAMMANDNEITIGAVRPDGTEKPEAFVLASFAQFARQHPESFTAIEPPAITMVTSQAQQYSVMWALATATQKKAVRALAYYDHQPLRLLPEHRVGDLGAPKLVIVPSAQALTEDAWQKLLAYVNEGGTLLVTGPLDRDEHWQPVDRLGALKVQARIFPLDVRESVLRLPGRERGVGVSYPSEVQTAPVSTIRFADGASMKEIAHGKGTILWAAEPVEFAEGYEAAAALYRYAMGKAGVKEAFLQVRPLPAGVLAFPTVTKNAVLYSLSSESLQDQVVDLRDGVTGGSVRLTLPAQRGAMVLLSRPDGNVLATRLASLAGEGEARTEGARAERPK